MAEQQKKGLFSGWFPKIVLLIGIALIIWVVVSGFKFNLLDIIGKAVTLILGIGLIVLIVRGIQSVMGAKKDSPDKRFTDKLTRLAKLCKPRNIDKLYMRGEDMRLSFLLGKVKGVLYVPYLAAEAVRDAKGNFVYVKSKDRQGNYLFDKDGKNIMVHQRKYLTTDEGEWFFVVTRGWFIFAEQMLIRAHVKLCSEIAPTTYIKTVNLVPFADFLYPSQQWQMDVERITSQHLSEVLLETHVGFWRLLEELSEKGVNSEPSLKKQQILNTESMGEAPRATTG
jgi:hypothetical protein